MANSTIATKDSFESWRVKINSIIVALNSIENKISYDFFAYVASKPTANQVIFRTKLVRPVTFKSGFSGSKVDAGTLSSGDVTFSVKSNSTEIGTINFSSVSGVAFLSLPSEVSLPIDSILTITAPSIPDPSLAEISITLVGSI